MSGYKGNNIVDPIAAPTLNQHREAILHEFMAPRDSYVSSHREDGEEPELDAGPGTRHKRCKDQRRIKFEHGLRRIS